MTCTQKVVHIILIIIFSVVLLNFTQREIKKYALLPEAFHHQGGVAASLPAEVIHMKYLAEKLHISSFTMTESLKTNPLACQRSVEFLYPIRMEDNATEAFAINDEPALPSWTLRATTGLINLYAISN